MSLNRCDEIVRGLLRHDVSDGSVIHEDAHQGLQHLDLTSFTHNAKVDHEFSAHLISDTPHRLKRDGFHRLNDRYVSFVYAVVRMGNRHANRRRLQASGVIALALEHSIEPVILDVAHRIKTGLHLTEQILGILSIDVDEHELGLEQLEIFGSNHFLLLLPAYVTRTYRLRRKSSLWREPVRTR